MKKKVLVFPCGSEIGLEIHRALRFSKHFELFGASSVDDHGMYVFENYTTGVPFVESEDFIDEINKIVEKNKIDYIFPAHDSVVLKLAQNTNKIKAETITSPLSTCEVARSKRKTYSTLKNVVKAPKEYAASDDIDYPVFLKPDVGQGSKGVVKVESYDELKTELHKNKDLMILEYLPGDEYTIDCFTNKEGKLLFSQGRQRVRTTNGISVNSKVIRDSEFQVIAERINSVLGFRGVWFFQLKKDINNNYALLEIAPRVAGTMALCRMQGVNLPLLSLYDAMGIGVSPLMNNFEIVIDRAFSSKYSTNIEFKTVYVDFDDTIVLEDKPNYLIIALLYKFIENNKEIVLITKHLKIIEDTLQEHRIPRSIFDRIISLKKEDNKSDYMKKDAIFIDDSYVERRDVLTNLGIPVFDISEAVELL